MNEPMNDDVLIQQLKAAARAEMPAFSPSLHEKIMRRIESTAIQPARQSRFSWRTSLSIAAAVLLCVGGWMLVAHYRPVKPLQPQLARSVPSMPVINDPVAALDQTVASNWPGDRYASLDQDGQALLHFVGRELDVAPAMRR